jgi:hypothetical protein
MGVVYKARDPKINRVVAVKTISLAGQPPEEEQEYRERFYREAEAAGRLSHPGIVTIFDVGEEPETHFPYIVMEFVGGESLDKVLSRSDRKLPLDAALQLTHELAEALDCAHGQGVVHRDLKPANILLTEDGHAKIADFGVAKLNLANHTLAGRALGTPAYMSPEQLNGENVDGRSDLFSLGVVLYTMLTGYRPFQGNSALTVSYKVVNRDPIPASVLETELPPGLDYIISRAMAKEPAQRYQRGMEMALDIQDLREGRELWSKAKQPGAAAGLATPVPGEKEKSPKAQAVKPRPTQRANQTPQNPTEALVNQMARKYLVGSLLAFGLLLFAFRVGHAFFPGRAAAGDVAANIRVIPLPLAGEGVAVKKALPAPVASPVPPAASPTPSAGSTPDAVEPEVKPVKTAKSRPVPTVHHSSAKVTPAISGSNASPAKAVAGSPSVPAAAPAANAAMLDIQVDHKFAEAHLSIWVDSHLTYDHALEGTDKKRLVVFHHVQGHEIHAMQIQAGSHQLRVQITSGANSFDQSVTGDFSSGAEKLLRISFDKRGEMSLNLD